MRDEKPSGAGFPVGDDGIAARASLSDRTELFGSPLRARLDLLVDREVLDPDKVRVDAKFTPFDKVDEPTTTRTDYDRYTRLRYVYELECLKTVCVPETLTKPLDLPDSVVRHDGVPVEVVKWPRGHDRVAVRGAHGRPQRPDRAAALRPAVARDAAAAGGHVPRRPDDDHRALRRARARAARRVPLLRPEGVPGRAARLPPPAAREADAARTRPRRARAGARAGIEREQRLALDKLAHELSSGGQSALAGDARRLAWEEDVPDAERTGDALRVRCAT